MPGSPKPHTVVCGICKAEFQAVKAKYCSNACRDARKGITDAAQYVTMKCKECRVIFRSRLTHVQGEPKQYCSEQCRKRFYNFTHPKSMRADMPVRGVRDPESEDDDLPLLPAPPVRDLYEATCFACARQTFIEWTPEEYRTQRPQYCQHCVGRARIFFLAVPQVRAAGLAQPVRTLEYGWSNPTKLSAV